MQLTDHPDAGLACGALAVAVRGGAMPGVIMHTDQGSEYTAGRFRAACQRLGIRQSMGQPGSALDNSVIESWHSTVESGLRRIEHRMLARDVWPAQEDIGPVLCMPARREYDLGEGRSGGVMTAIDERRHPARMGSRLDVKALVVFFALAYALSWSWAFSLVAAHLVVLRGAGWPTHYPALFGPAIAAVVVTAWTLGREGVRDLRRL